MTTPAGIVRKTKDNSRRNYRAREDWQTGKKLGRPKQVFNEETKTWEKK